MIVCFHVISFDTLEMVFFWWSFNIGVHDNQYSPLFAFSYFKMPKYTGIRPGTHILKNIFVDRYVFIQNYATGCAVDAELALGSDTYYQKHHKITKSTMSLCLLTSEVHNLENP